MSSPVIKLGATVLFASLLLSSETPASALGACQPSLSGVGHGRGMDGAMKSAVQNWQNKVEDVHGPYYGNYNYAKAKGRHCAPEDGVGIILCRVWAKPCPSDTPTCQSCKNNP